MRVRVLYLLLSLILEIFNRIGTFINSLNCLVNYSIRKYMNKVTQKELDRLTTEGITSYCVQCKKNCEIKTLLSVVTKVA